MTLKKKLFLLVSLILVATVIGLGIPTYDVYRAEAGREAAFNLFESKGGKLFVEGEVEIKKENPDEDEVHIPYSYTPKNPLLKFEYFKTPSSLYLDISDCKLTVDEFRSILKFPKLKWIQSVGADLDGKLSSYFSVMSEHPELTGCNLDGTGISSETFHLFAEEFLSHGK